VLKTQNSKQGYAIIAALWLAGLALALVAEFTLVTRSSVNLNASRLRTAELSAASSGMIRLIAWRLAAGKIELIDGRRKTCVWNNGTTMITSVQDHGGLLDANLSAEHLIAEIVEGLVGDRGVAVAIAAELIDYRDADTVSSRGTEEPAMRNSNTNKNAPLETIEELDLLPSITDDIYRRIKPAFTTFSGQSGIDPETMPKDLKEMFGRLTNRESNFVRSSRRNFQISVTAKNDFGASHTTVANVIMLQQPSQPFQIVTWNQTFEALESDSKQLNLQRCFN
jgi:general secretion pathway protein K